MTSIGTQYRIITSGAGWVHKPDRGRLRFDGKDGVTFLQALVSNDVAALTMGQGVYATYLTPQGRMLSDLRLYHRGTHLIADVPASRAALLVSRLDSVVFTEDVTIADVSADVVQIGVLGAAAPMILSRAFDVAPDAIDGLPLLGQLDSGESFIARTDDAEWPAFDVFVSAHDRDRVIQALEEAGARPISAELADALRIDAGRPAFGVDMTEDTIPLEAGLLERAISTTKGCYVGQEVVIRVLHRGGGRVAKRLVKLVFDPGLGTGPAVGSTVLADANPTGRLTSVAFSPAKERFVALGYVHRDVAEPGRHVTVQSSSGEGTAEIVGLAG